MEETGGNRRKKKIRNLYSNPALDRREKPQKNGGYSDESLCPGGCGRATDGALCHDCAAENKKIK